MEDFNYLVDVDPESGELYLEHYGTPHDVVPHSGRYPWGSGENPMQHRADFVATTYRLRKEGMNKTEIAKAMGMTDSEYNSMFMYSYRQMHKEGMSDTEISKALGLSTTDLRAIRSIASSEERNYNIRRAQELKATGMSNVAIAKEMGTSESNIRSWLQEGSLEKTESTTNIANILRENADEKLYLDVGSGVEREMGITDVQLKTAVAILKEEGYEIRYISVEQATNPGKKTTVKVLCPPGTTYSEVYNNIDKIKTVTDYDTEDGKTAYGIEYPKSIDSDRVMIRYAEDGGLERDGTIEIRRGVEETSLGESSYAQVRIAVDDAYYLKGMAVYGKDEDFPDGVDIIFNTNKKEGTPKEKVFKAMKDDPDNPFGATIEDEGQRHYIDENGVSQLSVINKVKAEGEWSEYSKTLASQMLSKQSVSVAKKQMDLTYAENLDEFNTICSLTNPEVKAKLLESYADDMDASAVHLKLSGFPRQAWHVILPVNSLSDDEIYAPNYKDGETVVLIRYPHGGTFEIPQLTVNNKNSEAKEMLGTATDAVGINAHVAARLSGADFDGDTVLVIPANNGGNSPKIKTTSPLKELENFDPKEAYPYHEGMTVISAQRKQTEMGIVSNLITDMTLKGATEEELARAVKHSMVVIDSEKHKLDYKQSYIDNGIAELKAKYQNDGDGSGASTLISRAKSETRVNQRESAYSIDPDTGKKVWKETGETYSYTKVNKKTGETTTITKERKETSTKMYEADDAMELVSKAQTGMELAYADYANKCKALANAARKELVATKSSKYSPSANKLYKEEVNSLNAKLNVALKNAPRERQAQLVAAAVVKSKLADNPSLKDDKSELKKVKSQALAAARTRLGAKKTPVDITDKEWEAIQAGAVSHTTLVAILNNTDMDRVKELAMPRQTNSLSDAKKARIRSMKASGYTSAEIADALGVSSTTVNNVLRGN